MSEDTIDYKKLAEALAEALEQRNLWIEGEEYRELVILRMRLSARVDSLAEELKAANARIAELEKDATQDKYQISYMYEDELPEGIPDEIFSAMYACSELDVVRLFPYITIDGHNFFLIDHEASK